MGLSQASWCDCRIVGICRRSAVLDDGKECACNGRREWCCCGVSCRARGFGDVLKHDSRLGWAEAWKADGTVGED